MKPMVGVSFRWEPELLERVRAVKGAESLSGFVRRAVLAKTEALEGLGQVASQVSVFPDVCERQKKTDDDFDTWGA